MHIELITHMHVTLTKEEPAALRTLLEQYFEQHPYEGLHQTTLQKIMGGLQERTDLHQEFTFRIYQQEALVLRDVFGAVLPGNEAQAQVMKKLLSKIEECRNYLSVRSETQDGP